ncbi:NACHT domain-containing protein [Moritella dasanensis]|uniref:NACHT domain-containing protein n=1 Tax=Moritella dasanensis TaxID=428031 RepID=UPI0002D2E23C|nr:NACHT domain-containing protein [Moritella dasanensis]
MSINCSQVIEKFRKYSFEYKKSSSNSSYLTFTFKSGFFHNAEIVQLATNKDDELDIIRKIEDLKELGVSIKRNKYDTIEQIEKGLFDGFFDVERWKSRIHDEYQSYTDSILSSFPESEQLEYKYINAPYSLSVNSYSTPENDTPIVDNIANGINAEGAQLILIEAPAGFGKTCTSYELIDQLAKTSNTPIPFFTEFSRDRQARVFGHVFVKEVDRAFSQVKSDVVIDELQNGRIVMVLDGFDELLGEDSKERSEENYENAEPMLETIGELLVKNAKIIITSRRAAIFDGSVFNEWVESYSEKFTFKRYRIQPPRIEDWLDEERRTGLSEVGLELDKLSNPVLLAYLRALKSEQFYGLLKTPEKIVSHYFTAMLEREMERQNLPMMPEHQTKVLATIAENMCEENYTSDGKDKIVELFKSKCLQLLEATRKLYPIRDRPTLDALASTLATHAFFDRSNQGEGRIEFINEFVFGNYIAESIFDFDGEWIASDERFVEPAIASYRARTQHERTELWKKLEHMKVFLSDSDRMSYEIKMLGRIYSEDYNATSINSLDVSCIDFFKDTCVDSISFSNCFFSNVDFYIDNIKNATFINCKFYDCSSVGESINDNSMELLNCIDNNHFILELEEYQVVEESNSISELTLQIFRRYFPVGSNSCERIHIPLASIYKIQVDGCTKRDITKEVKRLKRNGLLVDATDGSYIAINTSKMAEIKQLIGRV